MTTKKYFLTRVLLWLMCGLSALLLVAACSEKPRPVRVVGGGGGGGDVIGKPTPVPPKKIACSAEQVLSQLTTMYGQPWCKCKNYLYNHAERRCKKKQGPINYGDDDDKLPPIDDTDSEGPVSEKDCETPIVEPRVHSLRGETGESSKEPTCACKDYKYDKNTNKCIQQVVVEVIEKPTGTSGGSEGSDDEDSGGDGGNEGGDDKPAESDASTEEDENSDDKPTDSAGVSPEPGSDDAVPNKYVQSRIKKMPRPSYQQVKWSKTTHKLDVRADTVPSIEFYHALRPYAKVNCEDMSLNNGRRTRSRTTNHTKKQMNRLPADSKKVESLGYEDLSLATEADRKTARLHASTSEEDSEGDDLIADTCRAMPAVKLMPMDQEEYKQQVDERVYRSDIKLVNGDDKTNYIYKVPKSASQLYDVKKSYYSGMKAVLGVQQSMGLKMKNNADGAAVTSTTDRKEAFDSTDFLNRYKTSAHDIYAPLVYLFSQKKDRVQDQAFGICLGNEDEKVCRSQQPKLDDWIKDTLNVTKFTQAVAALWAFKKEYKACYFTEKTEKSQGVIDIDKREEEKRGSSGEHASTSSSSSAVGYTRLAHAKQKAGARSAGAHAAGAKKSLWSRMMAFLGLQPTAQNSMQLASQNGTSPKNKGLKSSKNIKRKPNQALRDRSLDGSGSAPATPAPASASASACPLGEDDTSRQVTTVGGLFENTLFTALEEKLKRNNHGGLAEGEQYHVSLGLSFVPEPCDFHLSASADPNTCDNKDHFYYLSSFKRLHERAAEQQSKAFIAHLKKPLSWRPMSFQLMKKKNPNGAAQDIGGGQKLDITAYKKLPEKKDDRSEVRGDKLGDTVKLKWKSDNSDSGSDYIVQNNTLHILNIDILKEYKYFHIVLH